MKLGKKLIAALLAVLMVITMTGCGNKMEKLESEARKLLENGDYAAVADLYEKALSDDGLDKEVIISKLEDLYTDWAYAKSGEQGTTILDVLLIMEELRDRFPDAKDYAEETLSVFCTYYMMTVGKDDIEKTKNLYNDMKDRYSDSEQIVTELDKMYKTMLTKAVSNELEALIGGGDLLSCLLSQDFEGIVKVFDDSPLESIVGKVRRDIDLPVSVPVADDKVLSANWVNGCLTVYYGALDASNKKTGEGVIYTHIVDGANYVKEVTYCDFTNDLRNGSFKQYLEKKVSKLDKMIVEGVLADNKFEGRINTSMTRDGETYQLVFNFEDGMVKVIGTNNNSGSTSYYVAEGTGPGGGLYYSKGETYVNNPHGLSPYYSSLN